MAWVISTDSDGQVLLSEVVGNVSTPWGVILDQNKALKLIEWLEWGKALEGGKISIIPPTQLKPKRVKR